MKTQLLESFQYRGMQIEVLGSPEQPYFIAKEVCNALNLADHKSALRKLDDDEKGEQILPTPGGNQKMTVINEPGLYNLVLRSTKPEAKAFKRWLTHEVLPAIRRKGHYSSNATALRFKIAELEEQYAEIKAKTERARLQHTINRTDWTWASLKRLDELHGILKWHELETLFGASRSWLGRLWKRYRMAHGDMSNRTPRNFLPVNQTRIAEVGHE